jgi:hypothetical protein
MVSLSPTESQEGQGCGNSNNGALFVLVRRFKEAHFCSLWPQMSLHRNFTPLALEAQKTSLEALTKCSCSSDITFQALIIDVDI